MNIVRRIIDTLAQRAVAIVGALLASRLETLTALEQAEQQDELEERARQFEKDGKAHLAEALRSRAARVDPDNPGAQGFSIIRQLEQDSSEHVLPLLQDNQNTDASSSEGPSTSTQPRRRRTTARRGRSGGSNE